MQLVAAVSLHHLSLALHCTVLRTPPGVINEKLYGMSYSPVRPGLIGNSCGSSFSKSRLLVTRVVDKEFIHLFEAEITSEILEMLDRPNLATGLATWPTIKHKKIPFQPYESFKERITAEILDSKPLQRHNCAQTGDDRVLPLEHVDKRGRVDDEEMRNVRRKMQASCSN